MRNKTLWLLAGGIMILGAGALTLAQFLPEDVAQRAQWEEFLSTAEIVGEEQMTGAKSVTNPWKLTLEKSGVRRVGLWKNVSGRPRGYIDNWKFELAAYRLDKLLGLNMVPPTVERNYNGPGSFQLWMDSWMTLEKKMDDNIKIPSYKIFHWNRALYLQRFFDNLIANDDRHQNNYLITQDWRMYLIDHSRSFRIYGDFVKKLQYTDKRRGGPMEMLEIPRILLDKIKALDFEAVRGAVGDYLTEDEIKAVLTRRDLILKEMDRICKKNGEANVLY